MADPAAAYSVVPVPESDVAVVSMSEEQSGSATASVSTSRQPWNPLEAIAHKSQCETGKEKHNKTDDPTEQPTKEMHAHEHKADQNDEDQKLNESESPRSDLAGLCFDHMFESYAPEMDSRQRASQARTAARRPDR